MREATFVLVRAIFLATGILGCARTRLEGGEPLARSSGGDASAGGADVSAPDPLRTPPPPVTLIDREAASGADAGPWSPPLPSAIDGPHEDLALDAGRPVWYALPRRPPPHRLIGHLHGMCGPPSYACGKWIGAGSDVGGVVCPTGNARCGDSPVGPPSWEAPSWVELVGQMDRDLEAAIAKVEKKRPGALTRDGAVLTGYSRGAYAAPSVARAHPGRWPYLVLIEANVTLSVATLRASGVRAVALVAGEQGTEIAGMQKTESELERDAFPVRLFRMRRTGHLYSDDMEDVMHSALAFVLER